MGIVNDSNGKIQCLDLFARHHLKGFTVKKFQDLRRSLPENTKLIAAKNTLVYKAIEGTEWEALKTCMTDMNAWLFVHTEEIPAAIKGSLMRRTISLAPFSRGNSTDLESLMSWRQCRLGLRFIRSFWGLFRDRRRVWSERFKLWLGI
ncbi:hypothetical protein CsatB_022017 [Cannabis sativa]